jgi:hypothetical protein
VLANSTSSRRAAGDATGHRKNGGPGSWLEAIANPEPCSCGMAKRLDPPEPFANPVPTGEREDHQLQHVDSTRAESRSQIVNRTIPARSAASAVAGRSSDRHRRGPVADDVDRRATVEHERVGRRRERGVHIAERVQLGHALLGRRAACVEGCRERQSDENALRDGISGARTATTLWPVHRSRFRSACC